MAPETSVSVNELMRLIDRGAFINFCHSCGNASGFRTEYLLSENVIHTLWTDLIDEFFAVFLNTFMRLTSIVSKNRSYQNPLVFHRVLNDSPNFDYFNPLLYSNMTTLF
jgi:hypothetical protein